MLDIKQIRKQFPILKNHPELTYVDSTATALKPFSVIKAITEYYDSYSANVFRGIYPISEKATEKYEAARAKTARFINAKSAKEIIFVRNTTEALNLIAYSLGRQIISPKSEILVSLAEHHSNFVTWQQLALENGATFKVVEVNKRGLVPLDNINNVEKIINKQTKLVALYYVSNVLGTINPLKKIIKNIRAVNPAVVIVVDAAQAAPHHKIDVQGLDCDFLAFSGHKMMAGTGIGVLWGRENLLEEMYPFQYGGEMIKEVLVNRSIFNEIPYKFEAGTPNIAGAISLGAAIDFLAQYSFKDILEHEKQLWQFTYTELRKNKNIVLIGPEEINNRTGILAFYHKKIHAHDVSQILAEENICIRAGHHCAMPLHQSLGVVASARISYYLYNTEAEVEKILKAVKKLEKLFL